MFWSCALNFLIMFIHLIIYVYKTIFGRVFNLSTLNTEWMLKTSNQTPHHILCLYTKSVQYNLNLYLII